MKLKKPLLFGAVVDGTFVDYIHASDDYIEWTINAPATGDYDLSFRYALDGLGDRPLQIKVNGQVVVSSLSFPGTDSWSNWQYTSAIRTSLNSGNNTVRATAIGFSGANMDHLKVAETFDTTGPQDPYFYGDPLEIDAAAVDFSYVETVADYANDPDLNETLTFSKLSGPAWLSVASDGTLSGTPSTGDVGLNSFTVRVTDSTARTDDTTLNITVLQAPLIKINFQPASTTVPSGWEADTGLPYGDRGNGLTYGWESDISSGARDRGDDLYQTLMQMLEIHTWEIALPNGDYDLWIVCGDPAYVDSDNDLDVEGVFVDDADGIDARDDFYLTVTVTDGKLTIFGAPSGNSKQKICLIEISPVNTVPVFTADPIGKPAAIEGATYTGQTIAGTATDPDVGDTLTYSKVSGPAWLTVSGNGQLSGAASNSNVGLNVFTVRVTDSFGAYDQATLNVSVTNMFTGELGLVDLQGLAANWLDSDCGLCGGADLSEDNRVNLEDFSMLALHWMDMPYPPELVGYWQFNETAGTAAPDASIYSHDGTLMNMDDSDWVAGNTGNALDFDGIDDSVQISNDGTLNPNTNSWSTSFWLQSGTASQSTMIVSKRLNAAPSTQYSIGLSSGNSYSWTAGKKLTFLFREAVGIEKGGYTTADIDISNWTHVCVVLDRSSETVDVYINGVLTPVTMDHDGAMPTINTASPLYIGGNPDVSTSYFQGQIDDVRVYNEALSQEAIQALAAE